MGLGEPGLGEQALSKAAEMGITQQLSEVEEVHVDIRTDPFKLMQGKVDSVSVTGEGMVMKDALRMEHMHMDTGELAINPGSAIFGKIELTHSAEANAEVTLTQEDVNHAFGSEFILSKMQNLTIDDQGQPTQMSIQSAVLEFLEAGKVHLKAQVLINGSNEAQTAEAIVIPSVKEGGHRIGFEEVGGAERSQVTDLLLHALTELADFRKFEFSGMYLVLDDLEILPGKMLLKGTTLVTKIPQA
jgi:LmeA-like phospholipid-binding